MAAWQTLGAVAPDDLPRERVALHWAIQPIAALANAVLSARDDDSQSNLGWSPAIGGLAGRDLPGGGRLALAFDRFALVREAGGQQQARLVAGETLRGLLDWAGRVAARDGATSDAVELSPPTYDMPDHPVAAGGRFEDGTLAARVELGRWFANGFAALERITAGVAGASEVRTWPHHFDVGALLTLDKEPDPERAKTIGLGLSPGDASYAAPYFYVTPYPQPAPAGLPPLNDGAHWHTDGWIGAILPAATVVRSGGAPEQERTVLTYFDRAISAARTLVAPPG